MAEQHSEGARRARLTATIDTAMQRYPYTAASLADAVIASEHRHQDQTSVGNTAENGAWHTVWLEGDWRRVTSKMATEQREYAADCVAAYSRYLNTVDGPDRGGEPGDLRWWRDDR